VNEEEGWFQRADDMMKGCWKLGHYIVAKIFDSRSTCGPFGLAVITSTVARLGVKPVATRTLKITDGSYYERVVSTLFTVGSIGLYDPSSLKTAVKRFHCRLCDKWW
jgi:hypothetical protein